MKKKSILCTVLVFSMILMGTAYAYWTDNLNVTTRATTGDLDVTFADLGLFSHYHEQYGWSIIDGIEAANASDSITDGSEGFVGAAFFGRGENYNIIAPEAKLNEYAARAATYNNVEFDAELVDAAPLTGIAGPYNEITANGSDNILLTLKNIYPGYAQAFRTDIVNVGTLAAKLSAITFDVTALAETDEFLGNTEDLIGVAVFMQREYQHDEDVVNVFRLAGSLFNIAELGLSHDDFFTVGGVDFVRLSALKDITDEGVVAQALKNNILITHPDDNRMDLFIGIAMDPDAQGKYTTGTAANPNNENLDANSENKGIQISMDFLWDQFNAGVGTDAPENVLKNQNAE